MSLHSWTSGAIIFQCAAPGAQLFVPNGAITLLRMKGGVLMPTFNQLVKQGRHDKNYKSHSPALHVNMNTLKKRETEIISPQKRGVCTVEIGRASCRERV